MKSHDRGLREDVSSVRNTVRPRHTKRERRNTGRTNENGASVGAESRVIGFVKFVNLAKGFGFITPTRGKGGDVFFRTSTVKAAGFTQIAEGATVECMAKPTEKRPEATKVLSVDLNTATGAVCNLFTGNGWVEVRLKRPTRDGLIFGTPSDGSDVLIPHSVIREAVLSNDAIAEGQIVSVKYIEREKGRAAVAVR